jgi:hypothetical protein
MGVKIFLLQKCIEIHKILTEYDSFKIKERSHYVWEFAFLYYGSNRVGSFSNKRAKMALDCSLDLSNSSKQLPRQVYCQVY